jgi:hypothetical protein
MLAFLVSSAGIAVAKLFAIMVVLAGFAIAKAYRA